MVNFNGYTLVKEQQEISSSTQVFMAKNEQKENFLVKRFNKNSTNQSTSRFKKFTELQKKLPVNQLISPIELLDDHQYCYAVFPFQKNTLSLTDLSQQSLSLENKLTVAINVCQLFAELHQLGFIVNNICPNNLYVNQAFEVQLYDLSFATKISALHKRATSISVERQYLSTLSPEASGRMNHAVEVYSDFYSIGACL